METYSLASNENCVDSGWLTLGSERKEGSLNAPEPFKYHGDRSPMQGATIL